MATVLLITALANAAALGVLGALAFAAALAPEEDDGLEADPHLDMEAP